MRLMILCLVFSACATISKPNANLCVVNAPAKHLKCYNLSVDYDDNGNIYKSAQPKFFRAETVEDLNKGIWMSNHDWTEVKLWIQKIRKAYENRDKK